MTQDKDHLAGGSQAARSGSEDARDAARYRWLRNQLAVEDIEEMRRNYLGTHDEAESVKCDVAVDAARGEPQ